MKAKKGDCIRITSDYYKYLKGNIYKVVNVESIGIFIEGYDYIILHSDYDVLNDYEMV